MRDMTTAGQQLELSEHAPTPTRKRPRLRRYFADVEKAATDAPDGARILLLERAAQARHLIDDPDPLGTLLRWKATEERN